MAHYGNRGQGFELLIEHSNRIYAAQGICLVHKRPTPVRILSTKGGRVTGFLESPSTVDFNGILQGGRAISFEAKEVRNNDRFPLSNIHEHQVEHLRKCHELGGVAFVLIDFPKHNATYLLHYSTLESYWNRWKSSKGARGTASIPRDDLEIYGHLVESGRVPVDYIKVVNKVWGIEQGEKGGEQTA